MMTTSTTVGYLVLLEYWNGSVYAVDHRSMTVYLSRKDAQEAGARLAAAFGNGEAMVDIIEVDIMAASAH
jgi:hypothetical protein